jgi:thiamine monophosphate synthase
VAALARVCAAVRLPVLAIGGIGPERFAEVAAAGASGFAAIGLFTGPPPSAPATGHDDLPAELARLRRLTSRAPRAVE